MKVVVFLLASLMIAAGPVASIRAAGQVKKEVAFAHVNRRFVNKLTNVVIWGQVVQLVGFIGFMLIVGNS